MTICQRYCELLGGSLEAESTIGEGSTFTVRLPAAPSLLADPDTAIAEVPAGDGPLVLAIDDEPSSLDLVARQLAGEEIRLVTALGGEAGLKLAATLRPSAIILDVLMPDLDGWSVLKSLKTNPATSDIPVVMCTIVDDEKRGYALGAIDYLVKPVSRERLINVLTKDWCANPPCHVLVVKDDGPTRELVCRVASNAGWQVDSADNGNTALELMGTVQPDLILLDLMMPRMDGFEFLAAIRRDPERQAIPVVVITAMELSDTDRERLTGYVDQIVAKGGREGSLQEVVARVLGAYQPGKCASSESM